MNEAHNILVWSNDGYDGCGKIGYKTYHLVVADGIEEALEIVKLVHVAEYGEFVESAAKVPVDATA